MIRQTQENQTETTIASLKPIDPETLAHAIFDVLDEKKAENIKVLRVYDHTVIADYFIICSGRSSTQVKSLGGELEFKLEEKGIGTAHYEGRDNGNWVVLDYNSVIVHIFNRESREFYKLEKLYGDAEEIHFMSIDEKAEAEEK